MLHAWHAVNGVVYARNSTHVRNSLIFYHASSNDSRLAVPGSIKYIFGVDGKISFAVQHQNVAPDVNMKSELTTISRITSMVY